MSSTGNEKIFLCQSPSGLSEGRKSLNIDQLQCRFGHGTNGVKEKSCLCREKGSGPLDVYGTTSDADIANL